MGRDFGGSRADRGREEPCARSIHVRQLTQAHSFQTCRRLQQSPQRAAEETRRVLKIARPLTNATSFSKLADRTSRDASVSLLRDCAVSFVGTGFAVRK